MTDNARLMATWIREVLWRTMVGEAGMTRIVSGPHDAAGR